MKGFKFEEMKIRNVVWLTGSETFDGERAPLYQQSAAIAKRAGPTGVIA